DVGAGPEAGPGSRTAVADVVGPAVAADDPDALAHEVIREDRQPDGIRIGPALEARLQVRDPRALRRDRGLSVLRRRQELFDEICGETGLEPRHELAGAVAVTVESQPHAHPEFRVVLEKGVGPGRAPSLPV